MLAVSVEYEENDFSLPDFQWSADAGEIKGNGVPRHLPCARGSRAIQDRGHGRLRRRRCGAVPDSIITVTEAVTAAPAVLPRANPRPRRPRRLGVADQAATANASGRGDHHGDGRSRRGSGDRHRGSAGTDRERGHRRDRGGGRRDHRAGGGAGRGGGGRRRARRGRGRDGDRRGGRTGRTVARGNG